MKRAALYMRVSTQDQNLELQEAELNRYVSAREYVSFKTYSDRATGTNTNRPAFKELIADARARKFDVLIIWKLDRLFRSLKDMVVTLQELSELGIEFISIKDNIDLTTSSGRLMMHLLGAFAEFEASLIRSRVLAGLANAKAKGKKLGRPNYLDHNTIYELRSKGHSLSSIANQLGCTKSGVSKSLKRKAS